MGEGPTLWMVHLHDLLSPTTLIDLDACPFEFVGVSIEEGDGGPIHGVADVVCASSPRITFSGVPGALDATLTKTPKTTQEQETAGAGDPRSCLGGTTRYPTTIRFRGVRIGLPTWGVDVGASTGAGVTGGVGGVGARDGETSDSKDVDEDGRRRIVRVKVFVRNDRTREGGHDITAMCGHVTRNDFRGNFIPSTAKPRILFRTALSYPTRFDSYDKF
ncbi:hypothetical protein CVT25_015391 [Psilocybe cyanescens]|uniref:Uncharacterized protein n=1 Tax=Psilocybe cyanescens TaxID=93625 RepID=A0A409X1T0_PSICY|nr:hypothetical protein CVT25_015391 [Psilocybe cyanescens]